MKLLERKVASFALSCYRTLPPFLPPPFSFPLNLLSLGDCLLLARRISQGHFSNQQNSFSDTSSFIVIEVNIKRAFLLHLAWALEIR